MLHQLLVKQERMKRRQKPEGPVLQRQGQRPPPSSMSRRSGKKTANKLLSFDTMNSGLQYTINALIQKDGGTSKNFVLLEFRNGIQRNKALIDQLELFNRLILDPDENEVAAQREKRKNFNNSRSVNRVGIWTGAENKQFPAVALQSVVGRYPGLFRQFFRENGTASDSLLRVASASNEYNFWKYDGSRNIRMNDRGEFDTIVLLCVISPNNDTTYDLDRDNLESRDTRNRNSLYEGLLYAKDKTFRMLAYKTKGKDGDLSRLPVGRSRPLTGESRASSPTSQSSEEAGQTYRDNLAEWAEEAAEARAFNGVRSLFAEDVAAAEELRMSPAAAAARAAEKRLAIAQVKNKINEGKSWKFSEVPNEDPEIIKMLREYNKEVKTRARAAREGTEAAAPSDTAMTPSEAATWAAAREEAPASSAATMAVKAAEEALKQVEIAISLNSLHQMQGQGAAAEAAAVKAAAAYTRAKNALEAAKAGGENTAAAEKAVEKVELAIDKIKYLLPRPKGGSRRTKKRKIERTRRPNKKHGR